MRFVSGGLVLLVVAELCEESRSGSGPKCRALGGEGTDEDRVEGYPEQAEVVPA